MTSWVRSSRCVGGDCLEAAFSGRCVNVRDSKLGPASPVQRWEVWEWEDLLNRVRGMGPAVCGVSSAYFGHVAILVVGVEHLRLGLDRHQRLHFSFAEWNAFVAGVWQGEFDIDRLKAQSPSWSLASSASGQSVPADVSEASAVHRHDTAAAAAGEGVPNSPSSAAPNGFEAVATSSPAGRDNSAHPVAERSLRTGQPGPDSPVDHPSTAVLDVSGCANSLDAGRPGPEAVAALVDLARPDPVAGVVIGDWAREWATEAFHAGFAAGVSDERAKRDAIVDAANEWARLVAPLVPEGSRPDLGPGGDPAEGGAAVTSVGGEVVPGAAVGVPSAPSSGSSGTTSPVQGQAAVRTAVEAGPVVRTPGPAEADDEMAAWLPDGEGGWHRVGVVRWGLVDLPEGGAER